MRPRLGRRGATAVEFALAAVPLLTLLFAVIEIGRLTWTRSALQGVAAETARCMGLLAPGCAAGGAYSAPATLATARRLAGERAVALSADAVTLERTAACVGAGGFSRVTLNATFQSAVPLLGPFASVPLTVADCHPNMDAEAG